MKFYSIQDAENAAHMAEIQRNNALADNKMLQERNSALEKALSDLLGNAVAKERYLAILEGTDRETYDKPDCELYSPEMRQAAKVLGLIF